jgi:NADH-quinone oxidoreductase subunit E
MRRIVVRAAVRTVRVLVGVVLLALSVGWLFLRRRRGPVGAASPRRLTVVPPVSTLDPPRPTAAAAAPAAAPAPAPAPSQAAAPDPAPGQAPAADAPEPPSPATPAVATRAVQVEAATLASPAAAADLGTATSAGAAAAAPAEPIVPVPAPRSAPERAGAAQNGSAGRSDDLRDIRGIGPATESALHEFGIHTFAQLAALDAAGRERLRIAIKDTRQRIEREDWVGQAAELHRAKYGEDPLRPV